MEKPEEEPITHVDIPEESAAPVAGLETPGVTLAELANSLTPSEVQMAKDQGLVPKDEAAEKKAKEEAARAAAAAAAAAKGGEDGKKTPEEKTVDERFRILSDGKSPETIMSEMAEKGELSKEQEAVLLASLTKNGQSMYWAQKKERKTRQKVEADSLAREQAKQKEIDDLKVKLAAAEARRPEPKLDENGEPIQETDEERKIREELEALNRVDPKDKPLTMADLERIKKEEAEAAVKETELRSMRATEIKEALNFQQEDAKTRYDDFDAVAEKAADLLRAANEGSLAELYPDAKAHARIIQKCRDLLLAFATADKFEDGDYNAADMTYELGKEHPGIKPKKDASKTGETGADGDPEKARRVITNANRRGSSATLNGGGSRRVSLEDLTPEQGRRIPTSKWNKLPLATREKLLGKV